MLANWWGHILEGGVHSDELELSAFYGTQRFITILIEAHCWILS